MILTLSLAGPALAVFGLVLVLDGADDPTGVAFRRAGWRAIGYGVALVVAAWLLAPWPTWTLW